MTATKDLSDNVVMTNQALELLTCFQDGVDELVAKMAEENARRRLSVSADAPTVIEVGTEDVRAAGERMLTMMKALVAAGTLPADLQDTIQEMNNCLNCR